MPLPVCSCPLYVHRAEGFVHLSQQVPLVDMSCTGQVFTIKNPGCSDSKPLLCLTACGKQQVGNLDLLCHGRATSAD